MYTATYSTVQYMVCTPGQLCKPIWVCVHCPIGFFLHIYIDETNSRMREAMLAAYNIIQLQMHTVKHYTHPVCAYSRYIRIYTLTIYHNPQGMCGNR